MGMRTKDVTVDDIDYTITEQTMRSLLPIMEGDASKIGVELAKISVFQDGVAVGDDILDLGFASFQKLIEEVQDVHGLGNAQES